MSGPQTVERQEIPLPTTEDDVRALFRFVQVDTQQRTSELLGSASTDGRWSYVCWTGPRSSAFTKRVDQLGISIIPTELAWSLLAICDTNEGRQWQIRIDDVTPILI